MTTDDAAGRPGRVQKLPELRWWWVAAAAAATAVLIAAATWLLVSQVATAPTSDTARAELDAIRTALSLAVGTGGAFALWLAARRQRSTEIQIRETIAATAEDQRHRERVQLATEFDLTERRITELYAKAVEQIGSDKAPVRLGGLYALERLANANPTLRQAVVNVICAYLRMPFPKPSWDYESSRAAELESGMSEAERREREELPVRLAAQGVLADHLREADGSPEKWGPLDLDLSRAVLIDFRFEGCAVGKARFRGTLFLVVARFDNTVFHGETWFYQSDFDRLASFSGAKFVDRAVFTGARFGWNLLARGTRFLGGAWFTPSEFCGICDFRDGEFARFIEFDERPKLGEQVGGTWSWDEFPSTRFNFRGARIGQLAEEPTLPDRWRVGADGTLTYRGELDPS
ncbi:pentapeptide repeat-containing protein [Amycolatopsis sp. FU40]|uniref:pentapeptide repeat-containing protein n=1 Tax=Amycolatopsis sp. FU40 TaxID=2914159 RepID=UPI001F30BC0F|nr:pentapeptide repeat-containing protein [Amycolatopsis sp. FU40]UKD53005.1 pentapeptide repeat-containing protein [Amycolatopsis sp. FU40]